MTGESFLENSNTRVFKPSPIRVAHTLSHSVWEKKQAKGMVQQTEPMEK
jgi:hypothetical protein